MKKTPKRKALETLQKLSRLAAADDNGYCECWSCGTYAPWNEMDGGHFIPKGHSSYWALQVENVHPQCKPCNGFGMRFGTAASQYTLKMVDFYGREFVDQMEEQKRDTVKFYKKDYEEMTSEWNELIKHHLNRVGA